MLLIGCMLASLIITWAANILRITSHSSDSLCVFHPELNDQTWLAAIKASFRQRILCNSTSFISLENEMQRKAMLQKQEDILNGKYGLDADTEELRMSEPYF